MSRLSAIAGCRSLWDAWASTSIPLCNDFVKVKQYMETYTNLVLSELKIITNYTGCLTPCVYKEYKAVGEPLTFTNPVCSGG